MIRHLTPLLLAASLIATPAATAGESAEDIVRASAEKRYAGNSVQTMKLTKTTKTGDDVKTMVMSTRVDGDTIAAHGIFTEPEPMAGVQVLSLSKDGAATRRWLYMPLGDSLNPIDSSRRTDPFMGTDFSHEDLELGDPDAGTHTLLEDETITVGGKSIDCHHLESVPDDGLTTAYGKIETWIEKGSHAPRRVDLYAVDDPSEVFKRLTFEGVAVEGGAVVTTNMLMENLAKGTSTRIEVTEYRLDVPADELPDALFDPEQLRTNVPR